MTSNPGIFSVAFCQCLTLPKSLDTLLECQLDVAAPAHVNYPSVDEVKDLVSRGADFNESNRDCIQLEHCTVHYTICFEGGNYLFVYLCVAKPNVKGSTAQEFLDQCRESLKPHMKSLVLGTKDTKLKIQNELSPVIKNLMMDASRRSVPPTNPVFSVQIPIGNHSAVETNDDGIQPLSKVSDLQKQVEEVKTVMSDNMIRILERGERLENLDHRTEALQASSQNFKTTARRAQRSMCWKNLKWTIILSIFLTILAILVILFVLKELGVL
jgi:hypothetical protein